MKINFAPICACKDHRRIWHQNINTSRSRDVTVQQTVNDRPWWQWRSERFMTICSGFVCLAHELTCKKYNNVWVAVNNGCLSLVMRFSKYFNSWLRHWLKKEHCRLALLREKVVFHGNPYIFHMSFIICLFTIWINTCLDFSNNISTTLNF